MDIQQLVEKILEIDPQFEEAFELILQLDESEIGYVLGFESFFATRRALRKFRGEPELPDGCEDVEVPDDPRETDLNLN